jgi:hypothetical protein
VRAPEKPVFVAFFGWLDDWDRGGRGFVGVASPNCIRPLALVDPTAVIEAGSLTPLESRRRKLQEVNCVLSATFALDVDGVRRMACHGWWLGGMLN